MKKIIVPTDFSDCAKNALKAAADIAKKSDAEIHLFHVYEKPMYGFAEANLDILRNREVHDRIEENLYKTSSLDFLKNVKVKRHIFSDIKIWDVLTRRTMKDGDIVIMGSHGASGWKELFIGSNTEKVIRYSDIPVLVIKQWHDKFEAKNIVFASDFHRESDTIFTKIKKLSNLFKSKIHLLKVITPGKFEPTHTSIDVMKEFVRKFYLTNCTINTYNDESVESGILNFSKFIKADLISIETHGRTGISHLINGSIAEDLANHVPLPVLSAKINYDVLKYGVKLEEK